MRLLQVEFIDPGTTIGRSIYSDSGSLLLAKGVVLSERMIQKLIDSNIFYIYIEDEISEGIEPTSTIDEKTMVKSIGAVKKLMDDMVFCGKNNDVKKMIPLSSYKLIQDIVQEIMGKHAPQIKCSGKGSSDLVLPQP